MKPSAGSNVRRLTIYVGEDKMNVDQPVFKSIVQEARAMHLAGATVIRAAAGYGRSTLLHTSDVLFSNDLPILVEIVDVVEKIEPLIQRLSERSDIGLMTCEVVEVCGGHPLGNG